MHALFAESFRSTEASAKSTAAPGWFGSRQHFNQPRLDLAGIPEIRGFGIAACFLERAIAELHPVTVAVVGPRVCVLEALHRQRSIRRRFCSSMMTASRCLSGHVVFIDIIAMNPGWLIAALLVRGVGDKLVQALKKRAKAQGCSAEAEQQAILTAALMEPPRRKLAELHTAMPDVGIDTGIGCQNGIDLATDVLDRHQRDQRSPQRSPTVSFNDHDR